MEIEKLEPTTVVIVLVGLFVVFWLFSKGLKLVIYLVVAAVIGIIAWSVYSGQLQL